MTVLMAPRLFPTTIQQIGPELAIAWTDGTETYLPLEFWRRHCPCALCGGEPDVLGYVERPEVSYTSESFLLRGWHIVGGYALQPAWQDGHSSGLYTFPLLQRLGIAAQTPATSAPSPAR